MTELPLSADCSRCAALCCVAPGFAASADFAIDKAAGQPCPHLQASSHCGIHATLREHGFPGCVAYDCFGAGQHVVQDTFGGRDWRHDPNLAREMFDVFARMRELHELLWHLQQAEPLAPAGLRDDLAAATQATERLARSDAQTILAADLGTHRTHMLPVLRRISAAARAAVAASADLAGADLSGADLTGTRPARVPTCGRPASSGATCAVATLSLADVTGADLRGADLGCRRPAHHAFPHPAPDRRRPRRCRDADYRPTGSRLEATALDRRRPSRANAGSGRKAPRPPAGSSNVRPLGVVAELRPRDDPPGAWSDEQRRDGQAQLIALRRAAPGG
jgi:hypothetical protein